MSTQKLDRALGSLLDAPLEEHFEPLDEFTHYKLSKESAKASLQPASPLRSPAPATSTIGLKLAMSAALVLIVGLGAASFTLTTDRANPRRSQAAPIAQATPHAEPAPQQEQRAQRAAPSTPAAVVHTAPKQPAEEQLSKALPSPPKPKPAVSKAAPPKPAEPTRDAAAWMSLAGELELQGKQREALHAYERASATTEDANLKGLAELTIGHLHARHLKAPERALTHYDRSLSAAPTGALSQEALLGKIDALRALERPLDEARAIKALLKRYPNAPSADTYKRRLQEIYAPQPSTK